MKTTYSISGFKGLKNSMPLEIKPLTILIGPNSAGKSSIIQSMIMLKQSLNNKNEELLTLNGDNVQLGSYKNIITDNKVSNPLVIDLLFEDIQKRYIDRKRKVRFEISSLHIKFQIKKYPKQLRVNKYTITMITKKNNINKLSICYRNNSYFLTFNNEEIELKEDDYASNSLLPYFYFMVRNNIPLIDEASFLIRISNNMIRNFFEGTSHISAYRQQPHRYYYNTSNSHDGIGTNGQNLASNLYNISKNKYNQKMEQINEWMKKLELTNKLYIDEIDEGILFKISLLNQNGLKLNLTDVGLGTSQILPIITESILCDQNTLTIIEQPEVHIQPKVQANLVDMFLYEMDENFKTFIIETHSEHIINRIQSRLADQTISPKDVAIYYISQIDGYSNIEKIDINEFGEMSNWPEGFFEDDINDAFYRMKHMLKRKKDENNE